MLRTAALICYLSYGMYAQVDISTIGYNDLLKKEFGDTTTAATTTTIATTTTATTNLKQCTILTCTAQQCSDNTPNPPKNATYRNLRGNRQCSCPCCGFRKTRLMYRVLGGKTRSDANEFPWVVAILKEEESFGIKSYDYKCVGSLIHPKVVLTAAHCISEIEPSKLIIRAGEHNTTSVENKNLQNIQVTEYVTHEDFGDYRNDIALMFLEKPVTITPYVNTICLPPKNGNFDGEKCLVSGWGKNGTDGNFQRTLRTVELPIVPRDKCESELRNEEVFGSNYNLHDSIICAGGEVNQDTCEGDGGAPLVCPIPGSENQYHQVGIVSWGVGCGDAVPAGYANVAFSRDWIDEKLRSKNLS